MLTISQPADDVGVTVRAVRHHHRVGLLPDQPVRLRLVGTPAPHLVLGHLHGVGHRLDAVDGVPADLDVTAQREKPVGPGQPDGDQLGADVQARHTTGISSPFPHAR